jgi:hypothetical protein
MFVEPSIISSVQAAAAAIEQKGGKNGGNGNEGVITACCEWLHAQQAEGLLVGPQCARIEALAAEIAHLELDLHSLNHAPDRVAKEKVIAAKRTELAAAQQCALWRPSLQSHEEASLHAAKQLRQGKGKSKDTGTVNDRKSSNLQQPLLWRDLALLLMLQAAAMQCAVRSSDRGEGALIAPRSPSSPLKQAAATMSRRTSMQMQSGNAASRRDSVVPSALESASADPPSSFKAMIPEESKQQQQQQQWFTAMCHLPYVGDGSHGSGGAMLLPLMQEVRAWLGINDE